LLSLALPFRDIVVARGVFMKYTWGITAFIGALICAAIVMVVYPQVTQGAPRVVDAYRTPPPLPPGWVNLLGGLAPDAAVKPGPLGVGGCEVLDVQLGSGWMHRSATGVEPFVLQDHAQKLTIACPAPLGGMAGYVDQDPKEGETLTAWRFEGDTPSQWTPAYAPDAWQTFNFSGATGIEIVFGGDSGGLLLYVNASPVTPTPAVTPNGTPTVTPEVTPNGTPTVTPDVTPNGTPTVTPDVTPNGTPTVTPDVTPNGTPTITPDGTPNGTPTVTSTPAATVTSTPTLAPTTMPTGLDPVGEPNLPHHVFLPLASR